MVAPFIGEMWLIDPTYGTQLIYVSPQHFDPPTDPIVTGKFTPGSTITFRVVYCNKGMSGNCYANSSVGGVQGTERVWYFLSPGQMHTEDWAFSSMPNFSVDAESWCGYPVPRTETDRHSETIIPGPSAIATTLTITHTALQTRDGIPILPQNMTLSGKLTRNDSGAGVPSVAIQVWRLLNTTNPAHYEYLGSATTISNGDWAFNVAIDTVGYYKFKAIFEGSGSLTYSEVETETIRTDQPVNNQPPIANFTQSKTVASPGESITFDASSSSNPDGPFPACHWNFGDGIETDGVVVSHAYANPGNYTITLTVTDTAGATGTKSSSVQIASLKILTIMPMEHGTTEPSQGSHTYVEGTKVTIKAFPDNGYAFNYFIVDGTTIEGDTITVTMNQDHVVQAFFKEVTTPPKNNMVYYLAAAGLVAIVGAIILVRKR